MSARVVASASVIDGEVTAWVAPDLGGAVAAALLASAVMGTRGNENDSNEGTAS